MNKENKYKCTDHKLELHCLGCMYAIYEKYKRLHRLVSDISHNIYCDSKQDAVDALREIGEL